ncbi:hypothetical protein WR25_10486 [Diploscapter pachys]|uniref:F-box domain-containing protein n=1 Tax=Diploscapter pachys TaxID=2018661 RepID=A0A2A2JB67_9BILA|nr:hypothetical protein WR25_10486 [Diploscapter pachys]
MANLIMPILLLPDELILYLDNFLCIEDTISFAQSCPRFRNALMKMFQSYTRMQLCDDHICYISNPKGKVRYFHLKNARAVLEFATNIEEILIIMKDVNISTCKLNGEASNMAEATPYTSGGYLGQIFYPQPPNLPNLKTVQIHIDVMFETFKEATPVVPTGDLFFALQHLDKGPFKTSVQVSFCCANFNYEEDEVPRNTLFAGMERCLQAAAELGAETELEAEPGEG